MQKNEFYEEDESCYITDISLLEQLEHLNIDTSIDDENLCLCIRRGDENAKVALCAKYIRKIQILAEKYLQLSYAALTLEDLVLTGIEGLLDAASRFDRIKGHSFSHYSFYYMRQCIIREIQSNTFPIRIPIRLFNIIDKIESVNYLDFKTEENLAEELNCTVIELRNYERLLENLSTYVSIDFDYEFYEELENRYLSTEDYVDETVFEKMLCTEILPKVLGTLTEREQKILKIVWGFDGRSRKIGEAQKELAKLGISLTKEQMRSKRDKIIKKLNHPSRRQKIEGFYNIKPISKVKNKEMITFIGRFEIVGTKILYHLYTEDEYNNEHYYNAVKHYICINKICRNSAINVIPDLILNPDYIGKKIYATLTHLEFKKWTNYINQNEIQKIIIDMEKKHHFPCESIQSKLLNSKIFSLNPENFIKDHGLYFLICVENESSLKFIYKNDVFLSTEFKNYVSYMRVINNFDSLKDYWLILLESIYDHSKIEKDKAKDKAKDEILDWTRKSPIVYVYEGFINKYVRNRPVIDCKANVKVMGSNTIIQIVVSYCPILNKYYLPYELVKNFIQKQISLNLKMVPVDNFSTSFNEFSILSLYGYNAKQGGMPESKRRAILIYILDNKIMNGGQIISHLSGLISLRENRKDRDFSHAIGIWESDIKFVNDYIVRNKDIPRIDIYL